MPNIRRQIVGPLLDKAPLPGDVGIYIQSSDGREFTLTKEQIFARSLLDLDKSKTIAWLKSEIATALGREQVDEAMLDADFNNADGTPSRLEVG